MYKGDSRSILEVLGHQLMVLKHDLINWMRSDPDPDPVDLCSLSHFHREHFHRHIGDSNWCGVAEEMRRNSRLVAIAPYTPSSSPLRDLACPPVSLRSGR